MYKRQIIYFNIFFVCLLMSSFRASYYVLAGEMVECNPENKLGECPIDKLYHRCQIAKDENGRQKITYGRCETKEEDQNDDGVKEKICKCVEDPAYSFKYEDSGSNSRASEIVRQSSVEGDPNIGTENEEDDQKDDDTKGKGKKKGKEKQSDRN